MTQRGTRAGAAKPGRRVLISGAGISGLALAHQLNRSGFGVTVVEEAGRLRDSGYPGGIRGHALQVAQRMGILQDLRDAHIDRRRLTFLDADGGVVAALGSGAAMCQAQEQDLEVRRGDLVRLLHARVRDDVELLFDDAVASLEESERGADVTFRTGRRRTFDLVVGADGTHSATRAMVFGPERQFHRYLGYCSAFFTMPNRLGLSHELVMWNAVGRSAALCAVDDDNLHAVLTVYRPEGQPDAHRSAQSQRDLLATAFDGAGWEVPSMVRALDDAEHLFFGTAGRISVPTWSRGRVTLVGDAAYAPSFLTGQGPSGALVGAVLLADAVASHPDHEAAFAAYERSARALVWVNQALVDDEGAMLVPTTSDALEERNAMLRGLVAGG